MGSRLFGSSHRGLLVWVGILAAAILGVARLPIWAAVPLAVVAAWTTYHLAQRVARLEAEARIPEWKKREAEEIRSTYLGADAD